MANPNIPKDASNVGVSTPHADKTKNAPISNKPYLMVEEMILAIVFDFLPSTLMSLRINAIAFDFYLIGSAVYQVCEIPD